MRRIYDWNRADYPEFYDQTKEAVDAFGGQFYSSNGGYRHLESADASWYVPTAGYQPVMVKQKSGLWSARGF